MARFSRRVLTPVRAVVVPGTVDTGAEVADPLRSAKGKVSVRVGLVVDGETGMYVVADQFPMWVIQILRQAGAPALPPWSPPLGYTIPALRDPESGEVERVDVEALVGELEPYREAAQAAWRQDHGLGAPIRELKRAPGGLLRSVREVAGHVGDFVQELKAENPPPSLPRPTAASHPPVEGVDYDTWIRSVVGIGRGGIDAEAQPAYLEGLGFPAGRVDAVNAAWYARSKTDDAVAQWYGYDYHRLDPDGGP